MHEFFYEHDGVRLVSNSEIGNAEARAYIARACREHPECDIVHCTVDGEEVELSYRITQPRFERIRRITGYLVGTLERFNDGKRAEERDRVKHGV